MNKGCPLFRAVHYISSGIFSVANKNWGSEVITGATYRLLLPYSDTLFPYWMVTSSRISLLIISLLLRHRILTVYYTSGHHSSLFTFILFLSHLVSSLVYTVPWNITLCIVFCVWLSAKGEPELQKLPGVGNFKPFELGPLLPRVMEQQPGSPLT